MAAEGKVDVSVIPPQCHCGGRFSVEGRLGQLAVCRCQGCGKVVTVEPLRRFDPRSGDVLDLHAEAQRDALRRKDREGGGFPSRGFIVGLFKLYLILTLLSLFLWQVNLILQLLKG